MSGRLSPREREILLLACQGLTGPMIADALVISARTVDKHVNNLLARWDICSMQSAIVRAVVDGVVSMDDLRDADRKTRTRGA